MDSDMWTYDLFKDLQLVVLAVVNDLKENPIATIVQEVDGVGDDLLDVIPVHKEVAKAVEGTLSSFGVLLAMSPKFQCCSTERDLNPSSLKVPYKRSVIYVNDVLEALKALDAIWWEENGRTIAIVLDESIGEKEFGRLVEALKTNLTLSTLYLDNNSIRDNGVLALSEALKTNSTLTTLNLRYNSIGEDEALALAEALKTNSTLITLYLWGNSIGDNGAQVLAEALMVNSTLTTLELRHNLIGDYGAQALSEALKTNSTLTTLELQNNKIEDNGAVAAVALS
ncbi:MAG: hypothetical protein BYD32DRAFT_461734 [Podila humilis]|nr:MAG: hypothetical protein BYD32DRAFT_461734 [Podila humilis]